MPATKEQKAAINLYANILEEIKHRIAAIDIGTTNRIPVPAPFVREFCYLQIRMICELIALGCLVAHGDISATRKSSLQKEWSAETIINAMTDLHPDFFPLATKQQTSGSRVHGVDILHPPIMTKEELLRLYGRCGGILHRGNVRKLLKEQIPIQINYPEITAIAQKFQDLLASHMLVMRGGTTMFLCILRNIENDMRVQIAIVERSEPPKPGEPPLLGD